MTHRRLCWLLLLLALSASCNDGRDRSSASLSPGDVALDADVDREPDADDAPDAAIDVVAADVPEVPSRACDSLLTCGFYGQCEDHDGPPACVCHDGFTHEAPWCVPGRIDACEGTHGWTAGLPIPAPVERHISRMFPVQPGSRYGAAIAYWPLDEPFGELTPRQMHVWFPADDGQHAIEPLTAQFFNTSPDLLAMIPLNEESPGQRWALVDNGSIGVCSDVRLHMGVVEPQPGAWPILGVSLLEILDEFAPGTWPRDNGDAPAFCRAQSVAMRPDGLGHLNIYVSVQIRTDEVAVFEFIVLSHSFDPIAAREIARFAREDEGETQGLRDLSLSTLSDGVFLSGVLAAEFASWIAVTRVDTPEPPVWSRILLGNSPRGSLLQEPTVFEHRFGGETRRHVFARIPDGVIALYRWDDDLGWVDSGHVPGLTGPHLSRVGGSLFWIAEASPDVFDFVAYRETPVLDDPDAFQRARIGVPDGALRGGAYASVHSVDDPQGNHEGFQVVFDSEGTASAYYEQVQQGAAERIIVGGQFVFGLAEGCP